MAALKQASPPPKAAAKKAPAGKAAPPKRPVRRRRKSGGDEGGVLILVLIGFAALFAFEYRVAALVAVGIIPSIVMSLTDRRAHKSARIQCVLLTNLSGVVPFAMKVMDQPTIWQSIIMDAFTMVAMWGSAALGYILLYVGPIVASIVLQAMSQDKLKSISQQRQELVEMWGSEVLGEPEQKPKPDDGFIRPKRG